MIGKNSKEIGSLSLNEVYKLLNERKEESKLTYEQEAAYEHASKFKLAEDKYSKVSEELSKMDLPKYFTDKLLELQPVNDEIVKYAASEFNLNLDDKKIETIISVFKSAL